ncbi:Probable ABC transporter permease protein HI_1471 [Raoultella terrigena]|uniref:Probable ABC transporter permease protein HI_1471 n=1 Tax=Raoultella terrigena TaxID=577 RepID=A0A3P8JIC4_RAOTE|nr:Probable ABC transporter permease protein HI_1471 [Raoultella terrigena]
MLVGCLPLWLLRWRINLLTLSDDEARSLGINVARLRLIVVACATLATASAVAIAGIIGWVGLIVPHIGRLLTGSNHQRLLPVAMGLGAVLLLLTDTLARGLSASEIPLGILTSFIGAPFFLALLLRRSRHDAAHGTPCRNWLSQTRRFARRVVFAAAGHAVLPARRQRQR